MNNRKKFLVIALIVLTLVLGGVSIFLSQLLQNSQAPSSSGAAGFGESATKDMYEYFNDAFVAMGCQGLLSESTINLYALQDFSKVTDLTFQYKNFASAERKPVHCLIDLDIGRKIELTVNTYTQDSVIDPNEQALHTRVNSSNMGAEISQGSINQSDYYFGTSNEDSEVCVTNIFHSRNDFEYVNLKYSNFRTDCSELETLNGEVSYILGQVLNQLMSQTRETNNSTSN